MELHPNNGLTNGQLIKYLELPEDILTQLQNAEGSTYVAVANQFLDALFNKVVYSRVQKMDFTNPFKKFDGYPIKFGDTIENIFVEIPKGYKYDKDATDPFTRVNPVVKALYASINYEMQYETTIYDSLLRRACLSEYGFMNLIDTILGQLQKAVEIDEYFATIFSLARADNFADGIEELERGANDTETGAIVTKKIVNTVSKFKLPMTANNKARVLNVAPESRLLIVMKYDLKNLINLDYLTGLFNISKVGQMPEIIEVDTFQVGKPGDEEQGENPTVLVGDDIDFVIIDTDALDMHTALQDGGMIYNPKGKYTNHFYNLWKLINFRTFNNARAFKLVDPETSGDSSEDVEDGE